MTIANTDAIQSLSTLMGTRVDPTSNVSISSCSDVDIEDWYKIGGLSEIITNFWCERVFTEIEIKYEVDEESSGYISGTKKEGKRQKSKNYLLAEWLNSEFKRLGVIKTLIDAYKQCQIASAAPMVIITDNAIPLSQSINTERFNKIELIQIIDPTQIRPSDIWNIDRAINHRFVNYYEITVNNILINADRLIPFCLNPLLPCEIPIGEQEKHWGRPAIRPAVIEACLQYELAVKAAAVLIQKKNFIGVGIKDFLQGLSGSDHNQYMEKVTELVRTVQNTSNLMNVGVYDLEDMAVTTIERNVSGVNDCLDKIKDRLLSVLDNIPESYLLGTPNNSISNSANEIERIDATAQSKFNYCIPYINSIIKSLCLSSSCPVDNPNPDVLTLVRPKLYDISPNDKANNRLLHAQAHAIELANSANPNPSIPSIPSDVKPQ
jgi:hypothetical protein